MDRIRIYHGSMLVFGGLVGLDGLLTLRSGIPGVGSVLGTIGGLLLIAIAVHQIGFANDPAESVPGPWGVRMMALGTVLMAGGYLLQVAA